MKHRRNTKNKAGTENETDQKPRSKVPGYIAVAVFPDDWMWSYSYQQPEWRGILPRCHGSGSSVARVRTYGVVVPKRIHCHVLNVSDSLLPTLMPNVMETPRLCIADRHDA